jgi:hypothetical protein
MVLGLLAAACGEGPVEGVPDAGGADAAPVVQGSEATAELVINEISPAGDWIEIANRSSEALDLADYILTDSPDRIDHYVFLDGSLAPGELRVIEPDSFGLGIAEQVHLLTSTGLGVDGLSYLYIGAREDQSLARHPHAEGPFYFADPTPGELNP